MKRCFYIDDDLDDLDDLETLERELLAAGMSASKKHVLSQDTIHSGEIGAVAGSGISAPRRLVHRQRRWQDSLPWAP